MAGVPVVAGQPLQQRPGPQRLGDRVDPVESQATQGDRAVVVAGQVGRLGGAVQHRAAVQRAAAAASGTWSRACQGTLVVPQGLGEGGGAGCLRGLQQAGSACPRSRAAYQW